MPAKGCSYITLLHKTFSQESPFWPGKELHLSVVLCRNLKRVLLKGVTDKKKRMGLEKAQCGSQALTLCRGCGLQDLLVHLHLLAACLSAHPALQSTHFCTGTCTSCAGITLKDLRCCLWAEGLHSTPCLSHR